MRMSHLYIPLLGQEFMSFNCKYRKYSSFVYYSMKKIYKSFDFSVDYGKNVFPLLYICGYVSILLGLSISHTFGFL